MSVIATPRSGDVLARVNALARRILPQLIAFGAVGGIAFVVDVGAYNLLRATVMPDQVIWAKVVSVSVATIVAWVGHRYLTFRASRGRAVLREAVMFALSNVAGLLIASLCLLVSHYVLGFRSTLADNISGNVVGLILGTVFRFLAYRFLVFRVPQEVTTA